MKKILLFIAIILCSYFSYSQSFNHRLDTLLPFQAVMKGNYNPNDSLFKDFRLCTDFVDTLRNKAYKVRKKADGKDSFYLFNASIVPFTPLVVSEVPVIPDTTVQGAITRLYSLIPTSGGGSATKTRDSINSRQSYYGLRNSLMSANGNQIFTVLALGDSRIEQTTIAEPLRMKFYEKYGCAGFGVFLPGDNKPLGVNTVTYEAGVTQQDNTGDALQCFYGKADILTGTLAVGFSTTNDSLGDVKTVDIYYYQKTGGGSFKVVIDGVDITTISTNGTASVQKYTYTYTTATRNTQILTRNVSGTCAILTFLVKNGRKGCLFHRAGNGSQTTTDFSTYTTNQGTYWAAQLKPNLLIWYNSINDGTANTQPLTIRNNLLVTINSYQTATGANFFSALILGETGTRITDEYENRINSVFYNLTLTSVNRQYIDFLNTKDLFLDWNAFRFIPGFALTTSDNIHFGQRGGLVVSDEIFRRIHGLSSISNNSLFPRIYKKNTVGGGTTFDPTAVTPNEGFILAQSEMTLYINVNSTKVEVFVNGIGRVYSATATPFGYTLSGNVITAYDTNGTAEAIKTIEIEILP